MKAPRLCGVCGHPLSMAEKRVDETRCSDHVGVITGFDWVEIRYSMRVPPSNAFAIVTNLEA